MPATDTHTTTSVKPHEPQDKPKRAKKKRNRQRSRPVKVAIWAGQMAAAGYLMMLLMLIGMETRLVYPGAFFTDAGSTPSSGFEAIEAVQYQSTDGATLVGRLLERPGSDRLVLYFHGNAEKAKWLDGWLAQLSQAFDATAMIAEYRGYDDEMTPSEKGVLADCYAARDYLCNRYDKEPTDVILYGRSLGGGCAVAVAARGGARALVLERTFDRLVNVAADKYPLIPVQWLMRNRFDSVAKLTAYRGPLVVVHGTSDSIIPVHHGQTVFERAGGPKHWLAVEGMGHNEPLPQGLLGQIVGRVNELTMSSTRPLERD